MKHLPYNFRLVVLALFLAALWFVSGMGFLSKDEERVWQTVRSGQDALWNRQRELGIKLSAEEDRLRTGLIGTEWSPLTTTLGEIGAKRTSCNPLWAVRYLDWFDELGIENGDPIVIYSSSSFPALLFSALAAAESRGLDVLLSVSLGSSMWGANRPEFPWPRMASLLREGGFIRTGTAFYTPGGDDENGRSFSAEALALMRELSDKEGVQLFEASDLKETISLKTAKMLEHRPKLLINIGGGNANMGSSELALEIPEGLALPGSGSTKRASLGDGVVAEALKSGIPVLHMLNMKKLSLDSGIPWDPGSFTPLRTRFRPSAALLGLAVFMAVMLTHKRWRMEE